MDPNEPNIFEKFFGFFKDSDGNYHRYIGDPVADPLTDPRQFAWMIIAPILCFFVYRYFYKNKNNARKTVVILSIILLILRFYTHGTSVIWGHSPAFTFLSYHLCEIMCVFVPLVALFQMKWFKLPIYTISMMGAVATIYMGDQFSSTFFNSGLAVSIISHTLLLIIPLIEHSQGEFRFSIRESVKIFPIMLILMGWAQFGNKVLLAGKDYNYMFLEENGLPYNFGGKYYFLIYIAIFFTMYFTIFIPPLVRNRYRTQTR